jgi:DNA-binding NtrC family response regulator
MDQADGGTLYLDRIGVLPLALQGRLLNALETGYYRRVGGREMRRANVRIISSTHDDLPARIQANTFRSDLYHRLAGSVHGIPALRERREDIPASPTPCWYACVTRMPCDVISTRMRGKKPVQYDYPGNIHELKNTLQRAASRCADGHIRAGHIRFAGPSSPAVPPAPPAMRSLKQIEAEQIALLLENYHGHRREVAEEPGISERTLYRKLVRYQLNR